MSDVGTEALCWGETRDLVMSAAGDPSTALGAEMAGWAYPATTPQIIQALMTSAQLGRDGMRVAKSLMPWEMGKALAAAPTASDVAKALSEIDQEVIFADEQ